MKNNKTTDHMRGSQTQTTAMLQEHDRSSNSNLTSQVNKPSIPSPKPEILHSELITEFLSKLPTCLKRQWRPSPRAASPADEDR